METKVKVQIDCPGPDGEDDSHSYDGYVFVDEKLDIVRDGPSVQYVCPVCARTDGFSIIVTAEELA